jgi:hypothetical protein
MNEQKALQIANEYAKQHNWNCDIVWFAGVVEGYYFVWLKTLHCHDIPDSDMRCAYHLPAKS